MAAVLVKTLTMILVCHFCLSNNELSFRNSTIYNAYVDSPVHKAMFIDDAIKTIDGNIVKRSVSNKTEEKEKLTEDDILGIKVQNDTDIDKFDTTTEFDFNNTDEPCVGMLEYCNMTRDEYMEMLYDYIFPQPYEWVLIAIHAVVFIIGLIGNSLVCIAVYRNHSMRTVTNYFIVNLALADFMVILICLPPTVLWDVTETWFFGTAMCRIVLYCQVSFCFLLHKHYSYYTHCHRRLNILYVI